jgi:hypothetical protein
MRCELSEHSGRGRSRPPRRYCRASATTAKTREAMSGDARGSCREVWQPGAIGIVWPVERPCIIYPPRHEAASRAEGLQLSAGGSIQPPERIPDIVRTPQVALLASGPSARPRSVLIRASCRYSAMTPFGSGYAPVCRRSVASGLWVMAGQPRPHRTFAGRLPGAGVTAAV